MGYGRKLGCLIGIFVFAFGAQSAPAAEGDCAPTAGPTDVVPNPMPSTPWKGGVVGGAPALPCDQPTDAEAIPGGAPREPIDIPPNPEPRKEPVVGPLPAQENSSAVSVEPAESPIVAPAPAPRDAASPPLATPTPESTSVVRAKATSKKPKLRRGAKKAAKLRAKHRLKRVRRR